MGPRRTAMLLILAAGPACAQPAASTPIPAPPAATSPAPPAAITPAGRILLPPPLQWDSAMQSFRPALQQTATDFATLTGGLAFGMSPASLNTTLPQPLPTLSWNNLTLANEYPGEARYVGIPLAAAGTLRMDLTACTGTASYLVFLFNPNGLLRLSYRLAADKSCPDTNEAAQQIFSHYVPLGPRVAFSVRYRTGKTQVVDVTDPTAGYVMAVRWRQGGT
jgi:hypothetical protein